MKGNEVAMREADRTHQNRLKCKSRNTILLSTAVRMPKATCNTNCERAIPFCECQPGSPPPPRDPTMEGHISPLLTTSTQGRLFNRTVSITHSSEIKYISKRLGNENFKVNQHSSVMSFCPVAGTSPETINPKAKEEQSTTLAFVPEHHSPTSRLKLLQAEEKNIN